MSHPYLLDPTTELRTRDQWAEPLMLCPSDQILNLPDPAHLTDRLTTALLTADTTVERRPTTMDDWIARSTLATDLFLVVEPQKEVPVPWIVVNMVGETLGSMKSGPCEHRQEMQEDLFEALRNGSPEILETPETPETPGTIASDWIIEDILARLLWNLEGCHRVQFWHKSTPHINVTYLHLAGIKGRRERGQMLLPRDPQLPTCRQPPMALRSIQLVQP